MGATLAFLTPFVTLSFLITTPEAWVPALGDAQHGFPYLSGAGRLVLKDIALLAGGLLGALFGREGGGGHPFFPFFLIPLFVVILIVVVGLLLPVFKMSKVVGK